jgi:hypothetical protein
VEERVKDPRNPLLAIIFMFAFSSLGFSSAANVYITPNGSSQGACTTNPQTPAWFNNSANWGSGGGQIGPGTKVLLCGTITTPLTAQGSGSSGNRITITFDTGASITLPVCPSSGCLNIANMSNIVLDGGTTCGWVGNAEVQCNGTILPTASGSEYGNGGTSSFTIEATNCAYCEIRNLEIATYYHTSMNDSPSGDFRGIDQLGITTATATFLVHNMIIHDTSSAIAYVPGSPNDNGFQYYDNYIYNMNSGSDLSNNNNGNITAALLHNNYYGTTANWDTSGCSGHHNSMHSFAYSNTNSGVQFYDNTIGGNWGNCPTSQLFFEGSGSVNNNCSVFNNLFMATYEQENNGIVSITCGGTLLFANNTIIGDDQSGDVCLSLNLNSGGTADVENNIISNCNQIWETNSSASVWGSTFNNNTWGGTSSSSPWAYSCGSGGCTYANSLAQWRAACSCDANSTFGASKSYVGVNSNGTLQSGSPAIGAGANLTSIGITALDSDIAGNQRSGGSTPWDDGAYNYSSNAPPAPPTGLTAIVN